MISQIPSTFEIVNGIIVLEGKTFVCTLPEEMLVLDTPAWLRDYRNLFVQDARSSVQRGDRQRAEQSGRVVAEIDAWLRNISAPVELFTPLARRKDIYPLIVTYESVPLFLKTLLWNSQRLQRVAQSKMPRFLIECTGYSGVLYATESLNHVLAHPGRAVRGMRVSQTELEIKIERWM